MTELEPLIRKIPARVGIFYRDLVSGDTFEFNARADFAAASVIKLPILLEVYRQAQDSRVDMGESMSLREEDKVGGAGVLLELHAGTGLTLEDLCRLMIVVSDNTASNLLVDRVGMDAVNAGMQALGMLGCRMGRRFMEEPGAERDNRMTPHGAGRCYEALYRGEALAEPWRTRALDILRRQQYREKIPLMLPESLCVAHKTGELDGVRHDAGLVEVPERPYVLALFSDQGGAPWEVDRALAELSRAIFDLHLAH